MRNFAKNDKYIDEIIRDPIYDIRSDGTIWGRKPKSGVPSLGKKYQLRRLDYKNKNKNYWYITYYNKYIKVSRIIHKKFHGKLDPTLDVNHKDGNKDNNRPSNLEQLSNDDNIKHAKENGLVAKGEEVASAVLTEDLVRQIRAEAIEGFTYYQLWKSGSYGVDKSTIRSVILWKTWRHVLSPIAENKQP